MHPNEAPLGKAIAPPQRPRQKPYERSRRDALLRFPLAGLASLLASCAGGCAGGPALPQLPAVASVVGSLADLPKLATPITVIEPSLITAGSTEVYSRIARGAMACWFGAQGRLTGAYIFHADAAPTMNGGAVEIIVHERAVDQPKPWGYKAFRVALVETTGLDGAPGAGGTRITVDNLRMSETEAPLMRAEVFQWAAGTEGCKAAPAAVPAPPAPPAAAKAKPKIAAKPARPQPKTVAQSEPPSPAPAKPRDGDGGAAAATAAAQPAAD